MSLHLRVVRMGVNSLKSSPLAMPIVTQTLLQKLPSEYLTVTFPSFPTGHSISPIMTWCVLGVWPFSAPAARRPVPVIFSLNLLQQIIHPRG